MKRIHKVLVFAVPLVVFLTVAKLTNTSPPTNVAKTAPDAEPALKTRIYNAPFDKVENVARKVALSQRTYGKSWTMPYTGRADDTMSTKTLDVEVPVLIFTDDLSVTLEVVEEGTKVDVRSASRIGKGDFGENRRHIIQFLSALDAEMGNQ
jgi:uncharacterized protein (DUF1499 family)